MRNFSTKLIILLFAGVLMMMASQSIHLYPGKFPNFIGYFGLAFFGLCTSAVLCRFIDSSGSVVTISPDGIRERVTATLIPWSVVRVISTWRYRGQKVMVLAARTRDRETSWPDLGSAVDTCGHRLLGIDGLCIMASGLTIDYDTLLRTAVEYARASLHQTMGGVRRLNSAPPNAVLCPLCPPKAFAIPDIRAA
jgi:hypothetical protein